MPYLQDNLEEKVYQRFIHEALKRSDMMLFVLRHDYPKMAARCRTNIYLNEEGKWVPDTRAADIFYGKCKEFVENFEPYHLYTRKNHLWPSTKIFVDHDWIDVCLYKTSSELEPLLLQPGDLYHWRYPYYPEDLCFFKNNLCWFCTISHEEDAFLHTDNPDDVRFWESLGIKFFGDFDEEEDLYRWIEKGPDGEAWESGNIFQKVT